MNRNYLMHSIEGSVDSNLACLHNFIARAMRQVASHVSDEDLLYNIRLIIDELLLNGADHGNAWNRDKKVYLRIEIKPDGMCIVVRDEGKGFQKDCTPYDYASDRCGGRGLFLVESICESVIYEGNTVHCYLNTSS